jgi:fermentation-respiration switch protein FrsA (DUF1100 family)
MVLILASGLLSPGALRAQEEFDIAGTWLGTLSVPGQELRIVFNIASVDGGLTATMDSPDQGATGIPTERVTFENGTLVIEVPAVPGGGRYQGSVSGDGQSIEGSWSQGTASIPVVLRKVDDVETPARPQEPAEPYPYLAEAVTYENPAADLTLSGTLTLPEGLRPFPAVVLVTGSGPQDRNETVMGHRPFLILADHLTREGIAVLRYDDRGVGESTGDFGAATSKDFASDALAGVRYLKARSEIDPGRIGLIGHSEGGLIAPLVAAESDEVAFIVLLAGPGITGEEIILLQSELIGRAQGLSDEQISRNLKAQGMIFELVTGTDNPASVRDEVRQILVDLLEAMSEEERQAAGFTEAAIPAQLAQVTSRWMHFFLTYDPVPTLQRVTVPVLAINGEKDLQVPPGPNLAAIESALRRGANPDFETAELAGLNHLFQTAETGAPSEYSRIEETMAPVALTTVSAWILARF